MKIKGNPELIPLYASGLFKVDKGSGITSVIEYVYHDLECYYFGIMDNLQNLMKEAQILKNNFQKFLDEEEIYVNGKRLRGRCLHVEIIAPSCSPVSFYFYNSIGGKVRKGVNYYSNFYQPEETAYPYFYVWWFPKDASIKKIEMCGGKTEIVDNFIIGRVRPGERLCGREEIEFLLK